MRAIMPFVMVPQREVVIIERFGRFTRQVHPGLSFKIPFFENVAYSHSLKEQVHEISEQTAITADNVKIKIDGVLYFKITDAYKASYIVRDPIQAITLLAQTSMRSEIGLLELDRTFEERDYLNVQIKIALNEAGEQWGIEVQRYEIKDIHPPEQIRRSMELQAEAERIKRSDVLASEGERQSQINQAEAFKRSQILQGEGKAQSIMQDARSIVETLQSIGRVIKMPDGSISDEVIRMRLSEQYLKALTTVYDNANIVSLPESGQSDQGGVASPESIASAITMYKQLMGAGSGASMMPSKAHLENKGNNAPDMVQQLLQNQSKRQQGEANKNAAAAQYVNYFDDKVLQH